jgi:hypothetical protein
MGLVICLALPDDALALGAESIHAHAASGHTELSGQWTFALRAFLDFTVKDFGALLNTVDVD